MHQASHLLGLDNGSGPFYLWWSGFFSDITIFIGMGVFYWKHTCHRPGCWKIGKHTIGGSPYCTKHMDDK